MTFFSILETLLIGPLKLIFEIVFNYANQLIGHPGIAIIYLSLIINTLVLPLYRRADAMQKEIRDKEASLHDGIAHIRKTFSGDERMMILQTYYRQNHYKPTDTLNGSVSLLLEIPFFIAAYQFLSHLEILNGVSFGPISDLGKPDGLLVIGGLTINLLPIIMTTVNVISSALYLKGFPLKTKVQLYAMAGIFLILLYSSPSCLVFYWTLNNVFSLLKNMFNDPKKFQKPLQYIGYLNFFVFLIYEAAVSYSDSYVKRVFFMLAGLLILLIPAILRKKVSFPEKKEVLQMSGKLFTLGAAFLTLLIGLLIPSVYIAASPQEYVDIMYFQNPLWYIVSAFCLAAGTFLIWMRVFYWLADAKGKVIFARLIWIMCGVAFVNYMFFGKQLGIISSVLQYENGMSFSFLQLLTNLLILMFVATVMYLCVRKWRRVAPTVLVISTLALGIMFLLNIVTIKKSIAEISAQSDMQKRTEDFPNFQLSKTGKNVIVIMLDRGMGEYIPYIFAEKPELKEQFSGFTYYDNVISFGGHTTFAVPAMLGGYEYTPVEMNKRNTESMVSKHNEALKVMPVLFSQNGYKVTVCDPTFANYQWIPDLSIYDDYPDINAYITKGRFTDVDQKMAGVENNYRNFFCFSMMKAMPLFLQPTIYNDGRYHQIFYDSTSAVQVRNGISSSDGISYAFMEPYYVLTNLSNMTNVSVDVSNTFLFLSNDVTHEPMLLEEPDYTPAENVDNSEYDIGHADRFIIDGRQMKAENDEQMVHYHANMAAMIQLGNWFDYLRENDVYDNTKIILVSDHGYSTAQLDELILDDSDKEKDVEFYYPLLMVKDFNSDEFTISSEFMTNADVPTIAMQDTIQDPINPFTGKEINSDEKYAHDQFVILSSKWGLGENSGNTYLSARWASVREDLWNKNNWTFFDEEIILDEHTAP